jgi:hypothetical protein
MRVPNATQWNQPWRIHDVLGDFPLEDVWRLPAITGTRGEFDEFVALVAGQDPARSGPRLVRLLWNVRDRLGTWFGLGEIAHAAEEIPDASLLHRVPRDLVGTADDARFTALPFVPLYRTDVEFAAEVANRTMHGVMHLGWVDGGGGVYSPQMAVYVRPNGAFGRAYMRLIKPFRYAIVYPAMEAFVARRWRDARD